MLRFFRVAPALLVGACFFFSLEASQQASAQTAYAPQGIRTGSFVLYPTLGLLGEYNDNFFATDNATEEELSILISPELELVSNWSRHELILRGGAALKYHDDFGQDDTEHFFVEGEGRIDVSRSANIVGSVGYREDAEERGDPDPVQGIAPADFSEIHGDLQFSQQFNRFQVSIGGGYRRLDFDDFLSFGGINNVNNNDDRDRDIFNIAARFGYQPSETYEIFLQLRHNWRRFDDPVDDFGFNRDSDGFQIVAGVEVSLTDLVTGEVYIGYFDQDYDDPTLADVDGLWYGAAIDWDVTPLITIGLAAERRLEDTIAPGSSSYIADRVAATIAWEVLRNLLLEARFGVGWNDYQGVVRDDDIWDAGFGVTWAVNRYLKVRFDYTHDERDSTLPIIEDFKRDRFVAGVEIAY